jgi:hypothetical protein
MPDRRVLDPRSSPSASSPAILLGAGIVASSPASAQAGGDGLQTGESACYGSGGRPMIGLASKVLGDGRYTDLDESSTGR